MTVEGEKVVIRAARSRFSLSTLPAAEFPVIDDINSQQTVQIPRKELARLLEKTHFSMAQQDVRYYLNGMLLEIDGPMLRAVATDGHRLALCEAALESKAKTSQQVIVPRKGVLELQRVLTDEGTAAVAIGTNHVRAQIGDVRFTSKLIDGRFPGIFSGHSGRAGAAIRADRDILRQALQRTAILSNEKYRGIRINVKNNAITVQAHNPEQEEAEEEIEVSYVGRRSRGRFQRQLLARCAGGHRRPGSRARPHRQQQQLSDSLAGQLERTLRRHAHEALNG